MNDFYLTLHDLAAWFLDDVVVELLGDLKSKTIVFLGLAEKGKTPAAQAIAMAVSEYYIMRDNKDDGIQPGFRICSSLDQLRGESGEKYRPDILDDPDINMVPIPKWTAPSQNATQLRDGQLQGLYRISYGYFATTKSTKVRSPQKTAASPQTSTASMT